MKMRLFGLVLLLPHAVAAGQVPGPAAAPDIPVSGRDRLYLAEQFSNTVSVVDPAAGTLLGQIRLGDPQPANLSPLYRGQLLVHGMGFSPDHRTLAVVSIGSNAVTFIDTATNTVRHTTYVGRSPHEAFYSPDGREVWVSVRGEAYIAVLDATTFQEVRRLQVPNGPGMTMFSPDGRYAFVCSSFSPETVVFDAATKEIVARLKQDSPFAPNIAVTPEGDQVWLTLKDTGRVMVFAATPPFAPIRTIETGPITNHVNFARTPAGRFAYVTVGGRGEVQVLETEGLFRQVAAIPVGAMPHGLWPSGDGSRMWVGIENGDRAVSIDTGTNRVVASIPIGQAPQGIVYVPNAVPEGPGTAGLSPLGAASAVSELVVESAANPSATKVSLFDQGLTQVLQAAVTGLEPRKPYVIGLAARADGSGAVEPLARFMTNPAGAAVVSAVGPIRQLVAPEGAASAATERRWLVVASVVDDKPGPVLQVQTGGTTQ